MGPKIRVERFRSSHLDLEKKKQTRVEKETRKVLKDNCTQTNCAIRKRGLEHGQEEVNDSNKGGAKSF